jgi:hypothetical protein
MVFQTVYDINQLQNVINIAPHNSTILIKDGTYTITSIITILNSGIVLKPQTSGGVIFTGGNISFNITGNNNILDGIQFINTSSNMSTVAGSNFNSYDLISVSGNNNTVSNININNVYAHHFINIYSGTNNNTIIYCNIQNKPMDNSKCLGSMIQIQGDSVIVGNHKIQRCTFREMTQGTGGDYGCEPIRLGDSQYSTCNLSAVVEYCVFDNTHLADSETISVKSMYNIIRYNTFSNNPGSYLSYRNGNSNICYGNFFLNSSGIRMKQASEISIYNNYFYNCNSPITFVDMTGLYPDLSIYQNGINMQNNTFYNCSSLNYGTRQTRNNTIANNIFYQTSNTIIMITGNLTDFKCLENYYFGNIGNTLSGFTNLDPKLALNNYGYFSILQNSPVIGKSVYTGLPPLLSLPNLDTDSNLALDITGNIRVTPKDVGCKQILTKMNFLPINIPLSVSIIGPSYLQ